MKSEAARLQSVLGAPKDADPTTLKLFSRTAMEELVHERDEAKAEVEKLKKVSQDVTTVSDGRSRVAPNQID